MAQIDLGSGVPNILLRDSGGELGTIALLKLGDDNGISVDNDVLGRDGRQDGFVMDGRLTMLLSNYSKETNICGRRELTQAGAKSKSRSH